MLRLPTREATAWSRRCSARSTSAHSPYGYEFEFEALRAANELDDEGFEVGIYHSHPQEPGGAIADGHQPGPLPHWRYLIVSLEGEPEVRVWRIADGKVEEEAVDVE